MSTDITVPRNANVDGRELISHDQRTALNEEFSRIMRESGLDRNEAYGASTFRPYSTTASEFLVEAAANKANNA